MPARDSAGRFLAAGTTSVSVYVDTSRVRALAAAFPGAVRRAVTLVSLELVGNLRRESPVDEGALQNSWAPVPTGPLSVNVRSSKEYAGIVAKGRGAIVAKGRALRFFPKGSSTPIFRKSVGSAAANPYDERAIATTEQRVEALVAIAIAEVTSAT